MDVFTYMLCNKAIMMSFSSESYDISILDSRIIKGLLMSTFKLDFLHITLKIVGQKFLRFSYGQIFYTVLSYTRIMFLDYALHFS